VAGPFYVEFGCCTACGVPESIAPEMFAYDSTQHCYVKRQPQSGDDLERALKILRTQDLGCVRYGGTDSEIRRRLAEAGESSACDFPMTDVPPVVRNIVSFETAQPSNQDNVSLDEFVSYWRRQRPMTPIRTKRSWWNRSAVSISWFEDEFHRLTIRAIDGRWMIQHHGPPGLSDSLHDWLSTTPRFSDIRWYTERAWELRSAWQKRPW